jgi:hypothetical protein
MLQVREDKLEGQLLFGAHPFGFALPKSLDQS